MTISFERLTDGDVKFVRNGIERIIGDRAPDIQVLRDGKTIVITPQKGDPLSFTTDDIITISGFSTPAAATDIAESLSANIFYPPGIVNGQTTSANSAPVVIASDQSSIPVKQFVSTSGTISTQNIVGSAGTPTALSTVQITLNGNSTLSVQPVGTYTGVLTVQASNDSITWTTITTLLSLGSNGISNGISSGSTVLWQAPVGGYLYARVTALSAVTGSATILLSASMAVLPLNLTVVQGQTITPVPLATQGFAAYHTLFSAATVNATNVKSSAANVGLVAAYNAAAYPVYFKFYNKASAPTVGTDTPIAVLVIPATSQLNLNIPAMGWRFSTGLSYGLTKDLANSGTTAVALNDVIVNIVYL